MPVVSPQLPLQANVAIGSTVRDSFTVESRGQQAASTGSSTTTLVTFAPGAWQLYMNFSMLASFAAAGDWGLLLLVSPGASQIAVVVASVEANIMKGGPLAGQFTFDVTPSGSLWSLAFYRPTTAVGQTILYAASCVGFRLN